MAEMKEFMLWMVQTVPDVLLEPPISMFVGMALLCFILQVIRRMMKL